jgi:hypothetical protein
LIRKLVTIVKETLAEEAAKHHKQRRKLDAYSTPVWATQQLLKKYPYIKGEILEPCSGTGEMAEVLNTVGFVFTNDIDPKMHSDKHLDARFPALYKHLEQVGRKPRWIVSNPPYNVGFDIVQQAVSNCQVGAAFLLRISFLEPTLTRGQWWVQNPPTNLIILPRISFTADGKTDSVTCAWIIWSKSQVMPQPPVQFVTREELKKC